MLTVVYFYPLYCSSNVICWLAWAIINKPVERKHNSKFKILIDENSMYTEYGDY